MSRNHVFHAPPPDSAARWKLVREFVSRFRIKERPTCTLNAHTLSQYEAVLGHGLPAAVREWYLLVGDIGNHWSGQDSLWIPREPIADGDFVPLMVENQNCFRMGYRIDEATEHDPPVHKYHNGDSGSQLSPSVTEFAIQMLILETIWSGTHTYFDHTVGIDGATANALEGEFKQCWIDDLCLWTSPTRFLFDDGVVIRIDYDGPDGRHAYYGFATTTQQVFEQTTSRLARLGVIPASQ